MKKAIIEKKLVSDNLEIYYRIRKGKGKSVVFLHGGGGSLSAWDQIVTFFLTQDITLITVDLRGHGMSGRPGKVSDYTMERHAVDISNLINAENLGKIILIGHCMGGMVGITFAASYPQKIEKLVLINSSFRLPWLLRNILARSFFGVVNNMGMLIFTGKKVATKRVDYSKYKGTHDLSLRRLSADLSVMGFSSAARQYSATLRWRGDEYIKKIGCSTLFINGFKDILYPVKEIDIMGKYMKSYKYAYVESNHISIINNPREVYAKIVRFLKI